MVTELSFWKEIHCPGCAIYNSCAQGPDDLEMCVADERVSLTTRPKLLLFKRALRACAYYKRRRRPSPLKIDTSKGPRIPPKPKRCLPTANSRSPMLPAARVPVFPKPSPVFRGATLICSNMKVFKECLTSTSQ